MNVTVITRDKKPVIVVNSDKTIDRKFIESLIKAEYSDDFTLIEYNSSKGWRYRFNMSGTITDFNTKVVPYKTIQ